MLTLRASYLGAYDLWQSSEAIVSHQSGFPSHKMQFHFMTLQCIIVDGEEKAFQAVSNYKLNHL